MALSRFLSLMALWLLALIAPLAQAQAVAGAGAAPPRTATEADWPRTLRSGTTALTVYPLQVEHWDGWRLLGRVAVRAEVGDKSPRSYYGVADVQARTLVDKGRRTVTLDQLKLDGIDFPAAAPAEKARLSRLLTSQVGARARVVPLDRLEASLAVTQETGLAAHTRLRNDPPQILFSETPAILVPLDGEPVLRPLRGTQLERVVNTRVLLLRDSGQRFYLRLFDGWMGAATLAGPWGVVPETPELALALKNATADRLVDPLSGRTQPGQQVPSLARTVPQIFVATRPTELVVLEGAPRYVAVPGTRLQYAENTTGNLFRHEGDNTVYVLLSGRWYRAASLSGPWSYVAANALPPDFAQIPDDSPKENVLAAVAGTAQAREAAIAAGVPQTASVSASGAHMTAPRFDGDPVLRPIPPTSLQYVSTSATPIVFAGSAGYFAVENGVWFQASSPRGPWRAARSVPAEIYAIPPDSPLYYVTFARIYDVDGDIVHVGYTPGYQGTYIDPVTGTVVYGTGYVYDPWVGTVWVGQPVTYGFGASVAYTPWTGWAVSFGFGWAWGAAMSAAGWGWGPYPWWGPWGWGWAWGPDTYPWYPAWGSAVGPAGGAAAWGPGGWAGYSGNIYRNWSNVATVSRVGGGYDAWTGNAWAQRVGTAYNSRTGVAAAGQRGVVQNAYTGNFVAGERGVATGPGGSAIGGNRVVAGNPYTGNQVNANRGAAYNASTGQVTRFGGIRGDQGAVGHIGDDVYAGRNGDVYRHTDAGWEQHTSGGGWQPVPGSAQGQATRNATGGLGGAQRTAPAQGQFQNLDRERGARFNGATRSQGLMQSHANLQQQFGGRGFGGGFGGRMGGGRLRR